MVAEIWYSSKDIPDIVNDFTDKGFVKLEGSCVKIEGENTITGGSNVIRVWCKKSELDKLSILDENGSINMELNRDMGDYVYRLYYIR